MGLGQDIYEVMNRDLTVTAATEPSPQEMQQPMNGSGGKNVRFLILKNFIIFYFSLISSIKIKCKDNCRQRRINANSKDFGVHTNRECSFNLSLFFFFKKLLRINYT